MIKLWAELLTDGYFWLDFRKNIRICDWTPFFLPDFIVSPRLPFQWRRCVDWRIVLRPRFCPLYFVLWYQKSLDTGIVVNIEGNLKIETPDSTLISDRGYTSPLHLTWIWLAHDVDIFEEIPINNNLDNRTILIRYQTMSEHRRFAFLPLKTWKSNDWQTLNRCQDNNKNHR